MKPETAAGRRSMSTEERRRQIIVAAAELFDNDGYSNSSMEDIAGRLAIAKPTLYHYFRSKEEIFESIHEEFIELLIDKYVARVDQGVEPSFLILAAMTDIFELMITHHGFVRVFFEHHRELSDEVRHHMTERRSLYESLVRSAIDDCQSLGLLRVSDTKLSTLALFGMCNWSYQWFRDGGRYSAREIARIYWDLFMGGLAAEPTRRLDNNGAPDTTR